MKYIYQGANFKGMYIYGSYKPLKLYPITSEWRMQGPFGGSLYYKITDDDKKNHTIPSYMLHINRGHPATERAHLVEIDTKEDLKMSQMLCPDVDHSLVIVREEF